MRNVANKSCAEYQNTFYVQQHFSENRAVYGIMWKNRTLPDRPQMKHNTAQK
jgi:hypothetical protein